MQVMHNEPIGNVVWHNASVTRARREQLNCHRGTAAWFISGSGKSTIVHRDNVRHGLCSDSGFSENDRSENIRQIAEMAKLFLDAGIIALIAFISPLRAHRELVRRLVGPDCFVEVYCACPISLWRT